MIIETLSWGTLELSEEQIYHFPKGIPGFDEEKNYALIAHSEVPFWYLQSLNDPELSFLLGDPFIFYPTYEFDLPDDEAEELGIQTEVVIRCMITLKEQAELSTINLLAPIVLNPVTHIGKQIVLHKAPYLTKHSLLPDQPAIFGKDGG